MGKRSAAVAAAGGAPGLRDDLADILAGLMAPQKRIAPKHFYDRRGSELFDLICTLPEYYLTRTELALMRRHGGEIGALVGPNASVIELGAGSSTKVRLLLDHLESPAAYVPVDISEDYLVAQAQELARDYPALHVQPVCADFTRPFALPEHAVEPDRNLVFFPGSTIGNFSREAALDLLCVMRVQARPGGAALIGVDLRKDPRMLHAAYNDSLGVTAAFNLNVLRRLNRELGATFDLDGFRHSAVYDDAEGRIEMRLVSRREQQAHLCGVPIDFRWGEHIVTEHSHKYSVDEFRALAERAGLAPERTWVDDEGLFSLHFLTVPL